MPGGNYVDVDGATVKIATVDVGGGDTVSVSLKFESEVREITTFRTYPDSDVLVTKRKVTGKIKYKAQSDAAIFETGDTSLALAIAATGFTFTADSIKIIDVETELTVDNETEVDMDFQVNGTYTLGTGS